MRFVRFKEADGVRAGCVDADNEVFELAHDAYVAAMRAGGLRQLQELGDYARRTAPARPLRDLSLLSPAPQPPSFRDFYAFEGHVRAGRAWRGLEMDPGWYQAPVFYFSHPGVLTGPGEIRMPRCTEQFDYELEVGIVLGRGGSDLSPAQAEEAVVGYCVLNDWSARDVQQRDMRQSLGPGKGKDAATSAGPFLVTRDEIEDRRQGAGFDLSMQARVNGATYSKGTWSEIHWSVGEMVAHASRDSSVAAGDLLGTGTVSSGCILELARRKGNEGMVWLQPGDVVEAEIDLLGTLVNTVVT